MRPLFSLGITYLGSNRWFSAGEGLRDKRKDNRGERSTNAEQDISLVRQVDENPFLPVSHSVNLSIVFSANY